MTCCLQIYRARIGTFFPRPIKKSCKTRAPKSSTITVPFGKFLLVLNILLLMSNNLQLITLSDSFKSTTTNGCEYTWMGGPTPSWIFQLMKFTISWRWPGLWISSCKSKWLVLSIGGSKSNKSYKI